MDRSSGEQSPRDEHQSADTRTLIGQSCELGDVSFTASLNTAERPRFQWTTPDGLEIVGCGEATRFCGVGPTRFRDVQNQAQDAFSHLEYDGPAVARPRAVGGVSFHDSHEPAVPWLGFGAATFVMPEILLTRSDDGTWLTAVATNATETTATLERWRERLTAGPAMRPSGHGPGVVSTERTTTREQWIDGVETALTRITDGLLEKVVLAQALAVTLEEPVDVPATLERLRRRYPSCYRFLVQYDGGTFFGAPPERLVSKVGEQVRTEALAGSMPRGGTPETDTELGERMLDSDRFQHEHGLVVEAIREQLEPLARDVLVEPQEIRQLATIQHLRTPITATLDNGGHVLDLVEALHPTPAVGGVPPEAAWETIRSVERFDRGWYAAPVGWFDGDGDGEFAVAIRSGVANDDTVTLFAGNGIVADSEPAEEWDEVLLKYRPILDELR